MRRCWQSWSQHNPGWDLRILDARTARLVAPLEAYVDLSRQQITAASLSDWLRLLLLARHGGVWADATLLCNRALDDWLPEQLQSGFFAFDKPGPDRPLASWFLAAEPAHPLVLRWLSEAEAYWHHRSAADDYFWLHRRFYDVLAEPALHEAWSRTPKLSADGPHQLQRLGLSASTNDLEQHVDWTVPVFKLIHRLAPGDYRPGLLAFDVLQPYPPLCVDALRLDLEALGPIAPSSVLPPP